MKTILPAPVLGLLRQLEAAVANLKLIFFSPRLPGLSYWQSMRFILRLKHISRHVDCSHYEPQVLAFIADVLALPPHLPGCVVEAGAYLGGSTAKFSLAAKLTNRELVVFDSFQGMPENDEPHDLNIFGHPIRGWFRQGNYLGPLETVERNIKRYGNIDVCRFVPGWFEDTLPEFKEPVCAIYLDVDLAESTKTCLKYLYPKLVSGGVLYSQDGDFPLVLEVFNDDTFWEQEVGCPKPQIRGLGTDKMLKIVKP